MYTLLWLTGKAHEHYWLIERSKACSAVAERLLKLMQIEEDAIQTETGEYLFGYELTTALIKRKPSLIERSARNARAWSRVIAAAEAIEHSMSIMRIEQAHEFIRFQGYWKERWPRVSGMTRVAPYIGAFRRVDNVDIGQVITPDYQDIDLRLPISAQVPGIAPDRVHDLHFGLWQLKDGKYQFKIAYVEKLDTIYVSDYWRVP